MLHYVGIMYGGFTFETIHLRLFDAIENCRTAKWTLCWDGFPNFSEVKNNLSVSWGVFGICLASAQNISWYVSPAHAALWVVAWSLSFCRCFLLGSFGSDLCSAWPPSTVHESCNSRHFHHASTYAMATDTNKTHQTARAPVCLAVTLFSATKARVHRKISTEATNSEAMDGNMQRMFGSEALLLMKYKCGLFINVESLHFWVTAVICLTVFT